jgi:CRISPR-associated protein Cmr4
MAVNLLFVHALSSLHPGAGQGVGAIDLPVARERATNLPFVAGSTLKGCLRAVFPGDKDAVFGKSDSQGKLQVGDARLLLLPVRSLGTTFVWATSPYALRRFQRDCLLLRIAKPPEKIGEPERNQALSAGGLDTVAVGGKGRLVLEDLDFDVKQGGAKDWADWIADRLFPEKEDAEWRAEFLKRFVVLPDEDFDYLCEYATEVNAHIQVATADTDNNLWYEETLPAETVLVSLLSAAGPMPAKLIPSTLQLGGNSTTGQGLVRLVGGAQ